MAIDNGYAEAGKTDTHTHNFKAVPPLCQATVQAGSMAGRWRRASLKRQCLNPALSNGGGIRRNERAGWAL